jgi:hypothetical protein
MLALLGFFWSADAAILSCTEAAAVAETSMSVPPGLLLAIGKVESGRPDTMGNRLPWPWTINIGGVGHFFNTAADAVLTVQNLRASGVQSIDIGCFQINLFHHPNAFSDLASGFDPLTNALAAARFLVSLHAEFGTWDSAIAAYHSRVDTQGAPYRDRVLAAWHAIPLTNGITLAGIHVWGPTGEIGLYTQIYSKVLSPMLAGALQSQLPRIVTISVH